LISREVGLDGWWMGEDETGRVGVFQRTFVKEIVDDTDDDGEEAASEEEQG
jgi:hypothetical protein